VTSIHRPSLNFADQIREEVNEALEQADFGHTSEKNAKSMRDNGLTPLIGCVVQDHGAWMRGRPKRDDWFVFFDIGCGDSTLIERLARDLEYLQRLFFIGVDVNPDAWEEGRLRLNPNSATNARFQFRKLTEESVSECISQLRTVSTSKWEDVRVRGYLFLGDATHKHALRLFHIAQFMFCNNYLFSGALTRKILCRIEILCRPDVTLALTKKGYELAIEGGSRGVALTMKELQQRLKEPLNMQKLEKEKDAADNVLGVLKNQAGGRIRKGWDRRFCAHLWGDEIAWSVDITLYFYAKRCDWIQAIAEAFAGALEELTEEKGIVMRKSAEDYREAALSCVLDTVYPNLCDGVSLGTLKRAQIAGGVRLVYKKLLLKACSDTLADVFAWSNPEEAARLLGGTEKKNRGRDP